MWGQCTHRVFSWRPNARVPRTYWDLSYSSDLFYDAKRITRREANDDAFSPPLTHIKIILDPHADWKFDIPSSNGYPFTVGSLVDGIVNLMTTRNQVPHSFWARASSSAKEAAVEAMLRRTGRHLRPRFPNTPRLEALEEEVLRGASPGLTNLCVLDLLGKKVKFAGLELYRAPDEWLLHTSDI